MLNRFRPRYCLLGVDISPRSIKILAVSYHKNQLCIAGYGYACLAIDGNGTSRDKLISILKTLLSKLNLPVKSAAIALPDSTVISKTIQIANNLTTLEAERFLFMEANKFLAGDISVDFSIIGPNQNNLAIQDVLLVATKTEHMQKRLGLLQEAGLRVKIVTIESQVIATVDEFIGSIYLAGEVAELKSFAQEIEEQTTAIDNSYSGGARPQKIAPSEFKKIAPSLTIALGLALRLAK